MHKAEIEWMLANAQRDVESLQASQKKVKDVVYLAQSYDSLLEAANRKVNKLQQQLK